MCKATFGKTPRSAVRGPRWGVLYAVTLLQVAALGTVEAVQSPHAARVALRVLFALGLFATMAVWVRANRPAFDLQNWCECAGQRMAVRVIASRVPTPAAPRPEPAVIAEPAVAEAYELVAG